MIIYIWLKAQPQNNQQSNQLNALVVLLIKTKPINKKPQENKETAEHTPIGESKKEKARGRPRIYDARTISKPKDPADAKHIIIM